MSRLFVLILAGIASFWGWCYFVPEKAARVDQFAGLCARSVEIFGGVLRPFSADLGDLVYSERQDAREKCAQMWWWTGAGREDLDEAETLQRKAAHPHQYEPRSPHAGSDAGSGAASDSASDATAHPNAPIPNASNPDSL